MTVLLVVRHGRVLDPAFAKGFIATRNAKKTIGEKLLARTVAKFSLESFQFPYPGTGFVCRLEICCSHFAEHAFRICVFFNQP